MQRWGEESEVGTAEVKEHKALNLNKTGRGGRTCGSKNWGQFSKDLGMGDVLRRVGDGKKCMMG